MSILRPASLCSSSKRACIAGIIMALIMGLAGLIFPISNSTKRGYLYFLYYLSPATNTIIPLMLSILITSCNESLGYIHTVSLRWALWDEGRLHFNTNLRLFTRSLTFRSNAWYTNVAWVVLMSASYGATEQVLFKGGASHGDMIYFNIPAFAMLSVSLAGQAVLAAWSMLATKKEFPTWSANVMNNTLACHHQGLDHRRGQLLNPFEIEPNTTRTSLRARPRLGDRRRAAIFIVALLWLVAISTLVWAFSILLYYETPEHALGGDHLQQGPSMILEILYTRSVLVKLLIKIFLFLAMLLPYSLSLHCTELLVNSTRDEQEWHRASNLHGKGANIDRNALREAITSWETVLLFVIKTMIYWVFGEAMDIDIVSWIVTVFIWANAVFLLAAFTILNAIFGTFLCFRRYPRAQPAAYGHLQTIVNMVDDWGSEGEPIFWGDKGHIGWDAMTEIRQAGTASSAKRLKSIRWEAKYIVK